MSYLDKTFWEDNEMRLVCRKQHYISIIQADYGFGICKSSGTLEIVKNRYVFCVVLAIVSINNIVS